MITLSQPVIVEGKYDKIKLSSIINATIITTDGFAIFKNKEKLHLIRTLAEKSGIIVMTDSDSAGMLIRSYFKGVISPDKITHVYIPEIMGKEKRKTSPSSEGLLGVEGVEKAVILQALKRAGVTAEESNPSQNSRPITKIDLFELGLTGGQNSSIRRKALLSYLKFPTNMSANALLEVLNELVSYDKLKEILKDMEVFQCRDIRDKK